VSFDPTVRFLLVDDVEENLLALGALLKRDGLELLKARSGSAALELLLSQDFALAILDVQMPGMDGFELAELMRGTTRTRHIPIIFLTAGGPDERRRFRGYEAGAVDFLFKPVEPTVLQGKADVFFDLYLQRQELIRQRDELHAASEENARLYNEILQLNESLEERVKERTTQLLEANEQLKGFTYSIAHDFRQHIRNINVNAAIVLAEASGALGKYEPNVVRIHEVAQLMNQMTDDLLTYARMRSQTLRLVEIDLTALGQEISETLKSSYPNSEFRVAEHLNVCADHTMIRIVLENLLDNAFKYSKNAAAPFVEMGKDGESFFVRDNGIGFDMAYASKLFLPFERLVAEGEFVGTGMGLANVKRILDRHNGSVWVDSEPGKGATFHFSLTPAPAHTLL
jgi:two-component system sensor histidine kinase/response regulator